MIDNATRSFLHFDFSLISIVIISVLIDLLSSTASKPLYLSLILYILLFWCDGDGGGDA